MQKEVKLAWRDAGDRCYYVEMNFPLPNVFELGDEGRALVCAIAEIEGVERGVLGNRYILTLQIGRFFDWTAIWPQVEVELRRYACYVRSLEKSEVDRVLKLVENPRPKPQPKPMGQMTIGETAIPLDKFEFNFDQGVSAAARIRNRFERMDVGFKPSDELFRFKPPGDDNA